jgi:hypothetical protein
MKKTGMLLIVFLSTFLLCFNSFAQDVQLNIQILNRDRLETLYISDLDILQLGSSQEFFLVGIFNFSATPIENAVLKLEFLKDGELLADMTSFPFEIPARLVSHNYYSNVDILSNQAYLGSEPLERNRIRVRESNVETDEIDNVERNILATGKAPAGEYVLRGTITSPSMNDTQGEDHFYISNPSFVQLVSPGVEAGSGFSGEIFSEFPVFQWNGNGQEYQVVVFEKKFAIESLDNILNMTPNWESPRVNAYSIQYPQASGGENGVVIPLEYGKTYYWAVRMFIGTSSGEEELTSEIYEFKLTDPTDLGNEQGQIARNQIIDFLRDIIGPRADELAKSLGGYKLSSIYLNEQEITLQEFYQIINEYRLKEVQIVELIFPQSSN